MRALQFWKAVTMDRSDFLERLLAALEEAKFLTREFKVRRCTPTIEVRAEGSNLRVQIRTQPEYAAFVSRAQWRDVLGLHLPVAAIEDLLQEKIWAASSPDYDVRKRLEDLTDIHRLIETFPDMRSRVPDEILGLVQ